MLAKRTRKVEMYIILSTWDGFTEKVFGPYISKISAIEALDKAVNGQIASGDWDDNDMECGRDFFVISQEKGYSFQIKKLKSGNVR